MLNAIYKKKERIKWVKPVIYTVLFLLFLSVCYAEKVNRDLSDSMIRLHIVATSDSIQDQSLKYRVRDAVIEYMAGKMNGLRDKTDAASFISSHLHEIEQVANEIISREGMTEIAKASFGKYPFPSKQYANMILPAGFYDALKIEIGDAKGRNWWCVMFPPLCFTEDTKGELDEEYMSILKEQLSEEEMEIILSDGDKEIPVEIRFKIVEIFQESKIKLAGLLKGIISIK
ncbi:MAG: stage II sporulation protein R [Clostridiaceae bacterium]|nr:stage II sporulation protein R [Clostridiaceae bacterium]